MGKMKFLPIVCLFLVPASLSMGCDAGSSTCLAISPVSGQADADSLYGMGKLSGTITNNCGHNVSSIRLTYKFYDNDGGAVVGDGTVYDSADLEQGEKYRFEVGPDTGGRSWQRYKLVNVEAN